MSNANEWKIVDVHEQEAIFDGEYKPAVDPYLLMLIVNHMAAKDDDEIKDMKNPKRLDVRVIIEIRELAYNRPATATTD